MRSLADLIKAAEAVAATDPTLSATDCRYKGKVTLQSGNLDSEVCFFARDLGKDEVLKEKPLVGQSGKRVRRILYEGIQENSVAHDEDILTATEAMAFSIPFLASLPIMHLSKRMCGSSSNR